MSLTRRTPRVHFRGGPLDGQTRSKRARAATSIYRDEAGEGLSATVGDSVIAGRAARGQALPAGVYRHAGSTPTSPRVHVYDWVPWVAVPVAEPLGGVPLVDPATSVEQDGESFLDELLGGGAA
jgi:hypothetical protein